MKNKDIMIIDFHVHTFPDSLAERAIGNLLKCMDSSFAPVHDGTVGGLLGYMDKSGVALSVLQPIGTKQSQTKTINEQAAEINGSSKYQGRIISFGGIFPHTDDYRRDIDFIVSLGLKGLKFHPEYQDFTVDDSKMLKKYDYALSKNLILLFHAGVDLAFTEPYRSSPKQFAHIVREMKGGVMIAAHLGGHGQWEEVYEDLAGEDIYIDTSMGFEYFTREQFLKILKKHGAAQILFASDSPWSDAKEEIKLLKSMPVSPDEIELILSGNAKRILNI